MSKKKIAILGLATVMMMSCTSCGKSKIDDTQQGQLSEISTQEQQTTEDVYVPPKPNEEKDEIATETDVKADVDEDIFDFNDIQQYNNRGSYNFLAPNCDSPLIQDNEVIYTNCDAYAEYRRTIVLIDEETDDISQLDESIFVSAMDMTLDDAKQLAIDEAGTDNVRVEWEEYTAQTGIKWYHYCVALYPSDIQGSDYNNVHYFVSQRADGKVGCINCHVLFEGEWKLLIDYASEQYVRLVDENETTEVVGTPTDAQPTETPTNETEASTEGTEVSTEEIEAVTEE